MGGALGMVGTRGLTGTIKAADAMTKSTNAALMGYEKVGSDLVIIVVCDDVGTVKVAVDVGTCVVEKVGEIVAQHVIPRPRTDVGKIPPKGP